MKMILHEYIPNVYHYHIVRPHGPSGVAPPLNGHVRLLVIEFEQLLSDVTCTSTYSLSGPEFIG